MQWENNEIMDFLWFPPLVQSGGWDYSNGKLFPYWNIQDKKLIGKLTFSKFKCEKKFLPLLGPTSWSHSEKWIPYFCILQTIFSHRTPLYHSETLKCSLFDVFTGWKFSVPINFNSANTTYLHSFQTMRQSAIWDTFHWNFCVK